MFQLNDIQTLDFKNKPQDSVVPQFGFRVGSIINKTESGALKSRKLTESEQILIHTINKYRFISLEQLSNLLSDVQTETLDKLVEASYLSEYTLINNGEIICRYYSVEYRGRGYLKSENANVQMPRWIIEHLTDPVVMVKVLSQTELSIRNKVEPTYTLFPVVARGPESNKLEKSGKVFRAYGIYQQSNCTLFSEPLRRDQNNVGYFLENKILRMQSIIKCSETNLDIKKPYLIIVLEDAAHMYEFAHKLYERFNCDSNILLTYDECDLLYKVPSRKLDFFHKKISIDKK